MCDIYCVGFFSSGNIMSIMFDHMFTNCKEYAVLDTAVSVQLLKRVCLCACPALRMRVDDGVGGERQQRQQRRVKQHRGGGTRASALPDVRRGRRRIHKPVRKHTKLTRSAGETHKESRG